MHFFNIIDLNYSILFTAALFVLISINPIHSLLNLIITFFSGTIFLILLTFVFIGLIFLAVYLGAIVVLFLFIVMMLDIKIVSQTRFFNLKWIFFDSLSLIFILMLFFLENQNINFLSLLSYNIEFINKMSESFFDKTDIFFTNNVSFYSYIDILFETSQLSLIGIHMFDVLKIAFFYCGWLLFIAMIGAIVLTVESLKGKFLFQQEAGIQSARHISVLKFNNFNKQK